MRAHEENKKQVDTGVPEEPQSERRQIFPRKTQYRGIEEVGPGMYRIRVRWTDPRTGRVREIDRTRKSTLREALLSQARWKEDALQGKQATVERKRVGEFAESWMRGKLSMLLPSTIDRYTESLDDHILPALGDFFLDVVEHDDIVKFRDDEKAKGYASTTVNSYLRIVKQFFKVAVAQRELLFSPAAIVEFLPEDDTRITEEEPNSLTDEEMVRFLDASKERWPQHFAMIFTLLTTAVRMSAVCALREEDIDWQSKEIVFRRRRYGVEVYDGVKGPNARARRKVLRLGLPDELAEVLRMHRQQLIAEQHPGLSSGLVFPSLKGTPRQNSVLDKPFRDILDHLGIRRRFTPHGVRRTANDLLRQEAGATVTKAITGHVTDAMHEHYATVRVEEKRGAIEEVLRRLEGARKNGGSSGGKLEERGVEKQKPAELLFQPANITGESRAGDGT
jgi:integrase